MSSGNISGLSHIAQNDPDFFKSALLDCGYSPWEDVSKNDFKQKYEIIINCEKIDDSLIQLFKLYLITKFLLAEEPPSWVEYFLSKKISLNEYLGFPYKILKNSRWRTVPVVLTGDNQAYIRLFVVGLLNFESSLSIPGWAKNILSQTSLNAIETAKKVAISKFIGDTSEHFLFCYPLTTQGKTIQFKDKSMSLPLAIGYTELLEKQTISKNLIATYSESPCAE